MLNLESVYCLIVYASVAETTVSPDILLRLEALTDPPELILTFEPVYENKGFPVLVSKNT